MQPQLRYIELKTGHAHNGPAWIARVEFSKSGKTVYFNGKALKGNAHGICFDIESGEEYWISGLKKRGSNRHVFGNGKVMVDREAVPEILEFYEVTALDPKQFVVVDLVKTDKKKFAAVENTTLEETDNEENYSALESYDIEELEAHIAALKRREVWMMYHGKEFIRERRIAAEQRLEDLKGAN